MTFGQLIGYNIGEKKSYIKHVGETTPNPFLKNQNWAYPWINSLKFYTVFLLYAKLRATGIYQN